MEYFFKKREKSTRLNRPKGYSTVTLTLLAFTLLFSVNLRAQKVSFYQFNVSKQGNVTALSKDGATQLGLKLIGKALDATILTGDTGVLSAPGEEIKTKAFPFGFNFKYRGISYSHFTVSPNGVVYFGSDSITASYSQNLWANSLPSTFNILYHTATPVAAIIDTQANYTGPHTGIYIKTEGAAGNRKLGILFENLLIKKDSWSAPQIYDTITYQINLYEKDSKIEIVYLDMKPLLAERKWNIGLRGSQNEFLQLKTTTTWAEAKSFGEGNNSLPYDSTVYPEKGLTFSFTIPPACTSPLTSNVLIHVDPFTYQANLAIDTTGLKSDRLLVALKKKGMAAPILVDGKEYSLTDTSSFPGLKFIASPYTENLIISNLEAETEYTLLTYAYNEACSGGPLYAQPQQTAFSSLFAQATIKDIRVDTTNIFLSVEAANIEKDSLMIVLNEYQSSRMDTVYKGKSKQNLTLSKLKANTSYLINVYSYRVLENGSKAYAGSFAIDSVRMAALLPAFYNFDELGHEGTCPPGFISSNPTASFNDSVQRFIWSPAIKGGFDGILNETSHFSTKLNAGKVYQSTANLQLPPLYLNNQGPHRFVFEVVFLQGPRFWGKPSPYTLTAKDSLCLQIREYGNTGNFKTIYVLNKENFGAVSGDYKIIEVVMEDAQLVQFLGKEVCLRLAFHSTGQRAMVGLKNFRTERLFSCDYPTNVSFVTDSITTNSSKITWSDRPSFEGKEWIVAYKSILPGSVYQEVSADTNPFVLKNLNSGTEYITKVAAKCSKSEQSPFSQESKIFKTLYSFPLTENFENIAKTGMQMLPTYWNRYDMYHRLSSIPEDFSSQLPSSAEIVNYGLPASNKALSLNFNSGADQFVVFPDLSIPQTGGNKILSFDLALDNIVTGNKGEQVKDSFHVFVFVNELGKPIYDSSNLIFVIGSKGMQDASNLFLGKGENINVQVDLNRYAGKNIRIALANQYYTQNNSSQQSLFVDNIYIGFNCRSLFDLQAKDISDTSVQLSWKKEASTSGTELLRYKKKNEATFTNVVVESQSYALTNLLPSTTYVWGVRNICSPEDSSTWTMAEFTTNAAYICDTVTNYRHTSTTKTGFCLAWTGDASSYLVQYKVRSALEWINKTVTGNTLCIEALSSGTTYEYRIQSICDPSNPKKRSVFTSIKKVSTLFPTCLTPTNTHVIEANWNYVRIAFESESTGQILRFGNQDGSQMHDYLYENTTADTIKLYGLAPSHAYKFQLRSYCNPGDSSDWTEWVEVTTSAIPPCLPPTELTVSELTTNSAKLSWKENGHIAYNLILKSLKTQKSDTIANWTSLFYIANKLEVNTTYSFRVQGICEERLWSMYSQAKEFKTEGIANEKLQNHTGFKVFYQNGTIHILNPNAVYVEEVEIFNTSGQRLLSNEVRSRDALLIPFHSSNSLLIVRIRTDKTNVSYKLVVL
ncbi:MAG: fibronectin type III domain-containing protein [Bacteroidales bacterium]